MDKRSLKKLIGMISGLIVVGLIISLNPENTWINRGFLIAMISAVMLGAIWLMVGIERRTEIPRSDFWTVIVFGILWLVLLVVWRLKLWPKFSSLGTVAFVLGFQLLLYSARMVKIKINQRKQNEATD